VIRNRLPLPLRFAVRLLPADAREEVAGDLLERWHRLRREQGHARAFAWAWKQPGVAMLARFRYRVAEARGGPPAAPRARGPSGLPPFPVFDTVSRTALQSARALARSPGVSFVAVLILALGIGAATAMSAVVQSVLRDPLPVVEQDRIVVLHGHTAATGIQHFPLRWSQFERFRGRASALTTVAGVDYNGGWPRAFRDGDQMLTLRTGFVTGNFFDVLGADPVLGRLLRPADDVVGAAPVMVVSYALWQRRFAGDPDIVGRRLAMPERDLEFTVVGVGPPGLDYPLGADFWSPIVPMTHVPGADSSFALVDPVGRLSTGTDLRRAREAYLTFLRDEPSLDRLGRLDARVRPLPDLVVGDARPVLLILAGGVALLLVIACVNVGSLMLIRASGRSQETAVRRALGAGRLHILGRTVTECALLAMAGGVLGTFLAQVLLRVLVRASPPGLPRLDAVRLAGTPVMIGVALSMVALVLVGLAPTLWSARGDVVSRFRGASPTGSDSRRTRVAGEALVAGQIALTLVVLASAGLVGRSLLKLQRLDPGFSPQGLTLVELTWSWDRVGSIERIRDFYDRVVPQVEALPGISAATPVLLTPFSGTGGWSGRFVTEGQTDDDAEDNPWLNMELAGSGYFRTFGLPILRGRGFTEGDRQDAARVAVVGEATAQVLWPDQNPLGKRVRLMVDAGPDAWWTVVGVAADARYRALREPTPSIYLPFRQYEATPIVLGVRSDDGVMPSLPALRSVIEGADPLVSVWRATAMEDLMAGPLARPRLSALLLATFAATALVLAALGVYAVLAYAVSRRGRELGIRLAVGADPRALRLLVLRRGVAVASIGAAVGLAVVLAGGRMLRSLLFDVRPTDPLTLTAVSVLLLAVALGASYLPARKATGVDPVRALKGD
jgi:putative ABC transport system permease protein